MNTLILESTAQGDAAVDVFQKLSDNRVLFLCGNINDSIATYICASLMMKDSEDPEQKITLFINSRGGDIRNVFMIYDTMKTISAPVETICMGHAMDEAAILLASGTPGMRYATKNSVISVGQLVNDWYTHSDLTNAKNILDQFVFDNKRMMEIFAKASKKPLKEVMSDFDRKVFMKAHQAVKYGLIDKEISNSKK